MGNNKKEQFGVSDLDASLPAAAAGTFTSSLFSHSYWGPYLWKTYKTVYEEVLNVASALRASGIGHGCKVGIYGANCPQWIVAMEACNAQSYISVPLYDTLGPGAVNFILDHAEVDVVFVQDKKVKELLNPECIHTQRLKCA
ncbi:hypothetical protein M8C21_024387 [Ambrosia artemisiifolia]|uniref:AMP-dependent synthetase/ligase domain-containing protein n=1 Tax=Ambrosia artemisiifolia TaxID=4212 RepID=A0AAD5CBS8_AMBAR|nr:hypothetical protein M8C21_024387 [Ambrosia artemisiifolia]